MSDKNDSPPNTNNCKSTPPTNRKVRNPFDKVLIERLHKPICSPGMCKIYKKASGGTFRWDIDQACTLVPADIVVCSSQFEPSPDPLLEKIAEEATEKFFSQEMVMPSPLESSKKVKSLPISTKCSQISSFKDSMKDAQTVLTLPPELPPEIEKLLQPFCTFTQEQNISGDYEITANGSLRRKLLFEEHSDAVTECSMHYDSEQTDDEIHLDQRPPSSYDTHEPVLFSPDVMGRDLVTKGMKRTFGTPLNRNTCKPRNKILDVVDFAEPCFSPIEFQTPTRDVVSTASSNSLASASISPVTKLTSSDEEKNNFTSPESEEMATCLGCVASEPDGVKQSCNICKKTPNKSVLKRSTSLKESPPRSRKSSLSFAEKRSLSMSSLHRSRSVQKLDFSMDMSVDGSFNDHCNADSESSSPIDKNTESRSPHASWSLSAESTIQQLVKEDSLKHKAEETKTRKLDNTNLLDETPVKGKCKSTVLSHEISKIRAPKVAVASPLSMSLDNSIDGDNPLNLEDKKIDFNNVDLKFLTENTQYEYTANATKVGGDSSTSFKRVDSGFNENTFYANASSYYESAIKPSELTVTDMSKLNSTKTALKDLTNVPWMRVDSGFKDETSTDSTQFYPNENSMKKLTGFRFSEARIDDNDKENVEEFDRFLQTSNKNDAMSMSDVFTEDMTFNCNFSSTPSKNKSRKVNS